MAPDCESGGRDEVSFGGRTTVNCGVVRERIVGGHGQNPVLYTSILSEKKDRGVSKETSDMLIDERSGGLEVRVKQSSARYRAGPLS